METAQTYRKLCLKQQSELRRIISRGNQHQETINLFLQQHAMLHSGRLAQDAPWSFEDEIFTDMTDEEARRIPPAGEHSIAWIIWHIARIEDAAMNLLVAGSAQILDQDLWLQRMKSSVRDTGNSMDGAGIAALSARVDIQALRNYRLAVGRRTRAIVRELSPHALKERVDPSRLEQVMAQGVLVKAARGIADYWGRRDIAGLLLMPATRHNIVHLNAAFEIKRRVA